MLKRKTLISYHLRVCELRQKELPFKEIFVIVEKEYFNLTQKTRYKCCDSFRVMHYRVLKEIEKRKLIL
jgi:hypothetical protein